MTTPDPQYVQLQQQTAAAAADGDPTDELVEQLHARYLQLLRGGQTTDGYPYPDPTDPLAEGADAIRALAEALAGRTVTIVTGKTPTDLPSSFPLGISLMAIGSAASAGWPTASSSTLITFNMSDRAVQIVFRNNSNVSQGYIRSGNTAWGPWASAAAPYGQASGSVTVNAAANSTSATTVTLPANTFTATPEITLGIYTSIPAQRAAGYQNRSASSFQVTFQNNTSTAANDIVVSWNAQQDSSAPALARAAAAAELITGEVAKVTCTTTGCGNEGIPLTVPTTWTDDAGTAHPVDEIICGVCGTTLTAIEHRQESTS